MDKITNGIPHKIVVYYNGDFSQVQRIVNIFNDQLQSPSKKIVEVCIKKPPINITFPNIESTVCATVEYTIKMLSSSAKNCGLIFVTSYIGEF